MAAAPALNSSALTAFIDAADELLAAQQALLEPNLSTSLQRLIDEYLRRRLAVLDLRTGQKLGDGP